MILLTGSTGFLGRELLESILVRNPNEEIACVIRSSNKSSSEERFNDLARSLEEKGFSTKNLTLISGDLQTPSLGLSKNDYEKIISECSKVLHCAACTEFTLPYAAARSANFDSTKNLLSTLAKSSKLPVFNHVSTAYVAGSQRGIVNPEDIDLDVRFRNSYEKTKAESEQLALSFRERLPVNIFRPSIIIGHSQTGITSTFNVLYFPAKLIAKRLLSVLPASPNATLDIVPVDYVANSISLLSNLDTGAGRSFHLTCGLGEEVTMSELLELFVESIHQYFRYNSDKFPMPKFIHTETLSSLLEESIHGACNKLQSILNKRLEFINMLFPYMGYMINNPRFDASETTLLVPAAPHFSAYAGNCFEYCFKTDWGKEELG